MPAAQSRGVPFCRLRRPVLNALSGALQQAASSRVARLKILREWVESHVTEPSDLRRRVVEQLQRMEKLAAPA